MIYDLSQTMRSEVSDAKIYIFHEADSFLCKIMRNINFKKIRTDNPDVEKNINFAGTKHGYMLEHIAEFTAWPILTGIFIGYIANRIMSGEGKGCCLNLVIGIVGSYAGAFISYLLDIELFGKGYLANFVFCVAGAIVVLWLWKKLFD